MNEPGAAPTIAGYRDLEMIGRGGFAVVYRAHDEARNRSVALKVLTLGLDDPVARTTFEREARGAGSLSDHPHIVTLYDSGFVSDGRPFLVMEYCPFGSVAAASDGPAPLADVLELGVKISGALATAHLRGILHRDIKPENILVTQYHEPALCDFGIASLADQRDGMTTLHAMTPSYAAPEVLDLGRGSVASDVYGLAATLYRLLAGRPPFGSVTAEGLHRFLLGVLQDPVPPLFRDDVPAALESLLAAAMAKSPDDRPSGAEELGRALQDVQRSLGHEPTKLTIGDAAVHSEPPPERRASSTAQTNIDNGNHSRADDPASTGDVEEDSGSAEIPPPPRRREVEGDETVAHRRREVVTEEKVGVASETTELSSLLIAALALVVALVVAAAVFVAFR